MLPNILRSRDVLGGALIVFIGATSLYLASDFSFGTSRRMGPGYFPVVASSILLCLGLLLMIMAIWRGAVAEGHASPIELRNFLQIIGATVFFGIFVRSLGLLPTLLVTVFLSANASRFNSLRMTLLLTVCITAFCIAVFILALGLPLQLFGPWSDIRQWFEHDAAAFSRAWNLGDVA